MKRKLAIYAAYIPDEVYQLKKVEDSALQEIESQIKSHTEGQDPVTGTLFI
jgi:hypothetical protein